MKRLLAFLFLGALTALPMSAKIVRTVEKTFFVKPGGSLRALTQGGDIIVRTGDDGKVTVTARQTIRAETDAEADRLLEKLTLTIDEAGGDVTAEAKYERDRPSGWFRNWPPVSVDFIITVPLRYDAELRTSGGDIEVGSLIGMVKAHTSGGDIRLAKIDGDVDAHTSGGDISLREGTARAKVHTSGGDILIEKVAGPVDAGTSGGDIIIRSAASVVNAHTSGGDVRATLTSPFTADCSLGTSGGDVTVEFPKSSAFRLDANTSGGDVDASGLTITIERGGVGKSRLVGSVNGGGPLLKLRSSGGDINVRGG
ncbi:MAG TPA: DUF4097 family beta strand repeat-containing protein [Opitutaceae bacterium]|nr:DUF4097 family beta strand repeat-containing protein [Opitutaceae bacterium]